MDDEQRRRRIEKLILIAVVAGPLTLWFFRSGMYLTAFEWARSLALRTTFFATALLSQFASSLALLMCWRSPMTGRRVGAIALAALFFIIGIPVVNEIAAAILYPAHASWPWWLEMHGYIYLIQSVIAMLVTVACFALLRRILGYRIVGNDAGELPSASPLSIAELLYWTSGFAVVFSLVPRLSEYLVHTGTAWPYWMLALAFAIESLVRVAPVFVIAAAPCRLPIRFALAFIGVIVLNVGQLFFTYRYAGFPLVIEYGQLFFDALFPVVGANLAMLWLWWHGERVVRLNRKTKRVK